MFRKFENLTVSGFSSFICPWTCTSETLCSHKPSSSSFPLKRFLVPEPSPTPPHHMLGGEGWEGCYPVCLGGEVTTVHTYLSLIRDGSRAGPEGGVGDTFEVRWDHLSPNLSSAECQDPCRNHKSYREVISKMKPPVIPFVPLILKGESHSCALPAAVSTPRFWLSTPGT